MRMTIDEMMEAISRRETPEQYIRRKEKLHRLLTERDFLVDGIEILGDDPRAEKKKKRLAKVLEQINELK